jgi:septal ring factor EnvC (AmiA/AmiB activator)
MASYEDEVDAPPPESSSSVVPWAVAIVALAMGGLAAFHFSSQKEMVEIQLKKSQDEAAAAKSKLSSIESAKSAVEQQLNDALTQKKAVETARNDLMAKNEDLTRQLAQAAAPPAAGGKAGKKAKVASAGKGGQRRHH